MFSSLTRPHASPLHACVIKPCYRNCQRINVLPVLTFPPPVTSDSHFLSHSTSASFHIRSFHFFKPFPFPYLHFHFFSLSMSLCFYLLTLHIFFSVCSLSFSLLLLVLFYPVCSDFTLEGTESSTQTAAQRGLL